MHELLVIEAWKEKVFPHFGKEALNQGMTNMNAYLAHYFEATLCNLLEISFFHQDACEAAGDDALLELTDYCNRKLIYLNTRAKVGGCKLSSDYPWLGMKAPGFNP